MGWPERGWSWPAGQGVQDLGDAPPEVEEEPGGQTPSGAERPVAEQKLPAVQGLQADWPARSWKLPVVQFEHNVEPCNEKVPCRQKPVGDLRPVAEQKLP